MISDHQIQSMLLAMIDASHYTLEAQQTRNYTIKQKSDGSFVTNADIKSQDIIVHHLRIIFGDSIPIISEEMSEDFCKKMRASNSYILVDPIDGTEHFIKNSDFLINLAIIENGKVIFGAIAIPKDGIIYYTKNNSVFKYDISGASISEQKKISRKTNPKSIIISGNRSCLHIMKWIEYSLFKSKYRIAESITCNTVVRYRMLFNGQCDIVTTSPFAMDWDIAPWEIILRILGYMVLNHLGQEIVFEDPNGKSGGLVVLNDSKIREDIFNCKYQI